MNRIDITRIELYTRIWDISLSAFAKEVGLPGPALKAACVEHDIPTPTSAYWSRLKFGKSVEKTPLPMPEHNPMITVSGYNEPAKASVKTDNHNPEGKVQPSRAALKKASGGGYRIAFESDPTTWNKYIDEVTALFPVATKLRSKRPIVLDTKEYYRISDLPYNQRLKIPERMIPATHLKIDVSKENLSRALSVFDSIISIFEAFGCSIDATPKETVICINGMRVPVAISEKRKRIKPSDSPYDVYEYSFTGLLKITVTRKFSFQTFTIEDTEFTKVEEKMDKVVRKIFDAMRELKEWKEESERRAKERERQEQIKRQELLHARELEKRKEEEIARLLNISRNLRRYILAEKIRHYATSVKESESCGASEERLSLFLYELEHLASMIDPLTSPDLLNDGDIDNLADKLFSTMAGLPNE